LRALKKTAIKHPLGLCQTWGRLARRPVEETNICIRIIRMTQTQHWQAEVEMVKDRLWPRIEALLKRLREKAQSMGFQVGEIDDFTDDQFSWSFVVHPVVVPHDEVGRWHETDFDVKFEISESLVHEGDETGINFRLEFFGNGGRSYRVIAPFNYTSDCWVPLDHPDALDTRLRLVEADAAWVMAEALDEHLEKPDATPECHGKVDGERAIE
jgi:hypothetical protein